MRSTDRALRLAGGAIVIGTALGFVLSYSALRRLAAAHGYEPWEAALWPLSVDFVAVACTALAMVLARRGCGPVGETWALAAAAALASLVGNVLSVYHVTGVWGDAIAAAMHAWAAAIYVGLWHAFFRTLQTSEPAGVDERQAETTIGPASAQVSAAWPPVGAHEQALVASRERLPSAWAGAHLSATDRLPNPETSGEASARVPLGERSPGEDERPDERSSEALADLRTSAPSGDASADERSPQAPSERSRALGQAPEQAPLDEVRERVRALDEAARASGRALTGAEVGRALGRSPQRGRALLAEVRAATPSANGTH